MQLTNFNKLLGNIFITILLIIILLILYGSRNVFYWKWRGIPYVRPWPFFGNFVEAFTCRKHLGHVLWDLYTSTSLPFIGVFVGDIPNLLIKDRELMKNILIKDFNHFDNRGMGSNFKSDPMGSALLISLKGPTWKQIRRQSRPIYSASKIRLMHKLMIDCGEDMTEALNKNGKSNFILETKNFFCKYTSNVITSTAFGIKSNSFKDKTDPFGQIAQRVFNFNNLWRGFSTMCYFIYPPLVNLLNLRFIDNSSATFMRFVFWKAMNERKNASNFRNDLIDILIEMEKDPNNKDFFFKLGPDAVVAQAAQFFLAGHETSCSLMSLTLYEFAKNPLIQERVRVEVLAAKDDFSYESLTKMTYLENCMKETLRVHPIVPFLSRICTVDYKIPGTKITLKKGTPVLISVLGLHYDEQYFPNPETFDPDRFLFEKDPEGFLAFGEGPRYCIGLHFGMISSKTGLANILSRYKVELCEQSHKEMKYCPSGFLLTPLKGNYLRFTKISKTN